MRVAHLSDLHLGYRAYLRTERGSNLRERDVASAFQTAVLEVVRLRPDVVVLTGDLFDQPDPPSTAFLSLVQGLRTLREELPKVPVLAIAGGRDTPRIESDPGPVAVLDTMPGVEAAAGSPRAIHLPDLDLHALLVPHRSARRPPYPELRPDPDVRWNLLVVRGEEAVPEADPLRDPPLRIDPEGWDWIAVGGDHRAHSPGPRIQVGGALERVGIDPWRHRTEETGFHVVDLDAGVAEFHRVSGRPVVDLAPVLVDPEEPEVGTRRLRHLLEGLPGGIDDKLLRVRLQGAAIRADEGLEAGLIQAIRARTAHVEFQMNGREDGSGADVPPPPEPLHLTWSRWGRELGEVKLAPGVWAATADAETDRILLAEAFLRLERAPEPDSVFELELRAGGVIEEGSTADEGNGAEVEPMAGPATSDRAEVRARWVETAGELEARSLEWVRDRQAAESRLDACRERAHELKDRIQTLRSEGPEADCPTCGRPLAETHRDLMATLREEWEAVVQDGTWWKRRREQLDEKPDDLRQLEREAFRLQAQLQEPPDPPASGSESPRPSRTSVPDRTQLRHAGGILQRATGGRIEGLRWREGGLEVVGSRSGARRPSDRDTPLVHAAMQVARLMSGPGSSGGVGGSQGGAPLVLSDLADTGGVEDVARLVELVASLDPPLPAVVVLLLPPGLPGRLSDDLRGVLELRRDARGRLRLRTEAGGPPRLLWATGDGADSPDS